MATEENFFKGIVALFVEAGVQPRRLQVWKQKLQQRGGVLLQHIKNSVTHVFAIDLKALEKRFGPGRVGKLRAVVLHYEWLEESLKAGKSVAPEPYLLKLKSKGQLSSLDVPDDDLGISGDLKKKSNDEADDEVASKLKMDDWLNKIQVGARLGVVGSKGITTSLSQGDDQTLAFSNPSQESTESQLMEELQPAMMYSPPNLNEKITDIFRELKTIYEDALGDKRRSFSYHKAILVLEKLPFEITSVDQVKKLPSIGKSLQDLIGEILITGTVAKLEHFREDEKVQAIGRLGAVWGIGPSIAAKLYQKGHRTLEDLVSEESLNSAQRIALKFHTDINTKIPRHEVQEMAALVQKKAESIEPTVIVICGGSYRRGKAFVGDMDMIMTHPDVSKHAGFLGKLVKKLKEIDFLTEDLQFRQEHNVPAGIRVDTYFGLCKYPGRELRHRIDFKVFPYDQYPYGLIAWTGNDVLNRRLRILADSKGYKLDEHGCYPVAVDFEGNKVAKRSWSVPCKSEREVFDFVGFPWLEPHDRNL